MLEEGHLRKYLVYAIGEILLVMIGILLALQVNNWNIERVSRIEEAEILEGLQREFEGYQETLERRMARHQNMLSGMSAILNSMERGEWASEEYDIDSAIWQAIAPPTSDFGEGVRDALVQSGRLELIKDRALREDLALWPRIFGELSDDEIIGRNIALDVLIPYLARNGYPISKALNAEQQSWPVDVRSIAEDQMAISKLLSDPEFHSLIEWRYGSWYHAGGAFEEALEAVNKILLHIERVKSQES